ncbi:DNA adenine methylase [Methanolapillus millepedarum]|uniref:Site-specific DNA-methyltransferase (adenine-specific) n=1 Tax=Methanolapillus millepedarum TaxID=3028296 RepID=A0AA96VGL5_9EURY|nr:hypothetical protein MsAc7_17350 [Methanosarcinaceae archaeon Ac7]
MVAYLQTRMGDLELKRLSPLNWIGGKSSHLDFIFSNFPSEHLHFIDVFGGSGAVLLNKQPSQIETYNDINENLVSYFRMMRDRPDELSRRIQLTPYSRREFENCIRILKNPSSPEIEKARAFFTVANQSFHQNVSCLGTGSWKVCINDVAGGTSSAVSKYHSKIKMLPAVSDRLKNVQIECADFRKIIKRYDSETSFFYVDPPYPHESRAKRDLYEFEMNREQHIELLDMLNSMEGGALVSTYQNDLYDSELKNWIKIIGQEKRLPSSSKGRKESEILFRNYDI